ncbi:HNH endonuclease [Arthrobacter phage Makai]|nr:HNH endonuclease [Arthrobacter phage Makai]
MHDWKVIPSFPDYEMNVLGDIRHAGTDSWVDQYLGRANFEDEKHLRVRLRRDGLPIANSVQDLLYETYPHLIPKVEEPEVAVKPRKPKTKRKSKRKPAGAATPYVDDLGPEWATIPGFQRYKINREGKVINRRSKQLVSLRNSNKGSPNYSLLDNAGVARARHPERLLSLAFRDLTYSTNIRRARNSAAYRPDGEWTTIPGRTMYDIHPSGEVRRASRHRVTIFEDESGSKYVKLKTDGVKGFKKYHINDLLNEVYGPVKENVA